MKIAIINGPNLNLLGTREPGIYGNRAFEGYFESLCKRFSPKVELSYFQSNHEGALIDEIQRIGFDYDGIVLNAGAYTHTSIAIMDAIKAISTPVIEVHISNVFAREPYRHKSMISEACKGVVTGFGLDSYRVGLEGLLG